VKILLFAGAGTSIELGVPGMVGMGEEFIEHAKQWDVEPALVQKLMGDSLDIEHLIEALDRICAARPTLEAIGQVSVPLDRADKIRAEVEWFVQHAAERVVVSDTCLMWGPVLRAASSVDLTLVTTNYTRAIELAANAGNVPIDDGFGPFGQGETAETALWAGFSQDGGRFLLVKLHGSTDWYAAGEFGNPTKLRHPMPLFGRASLRLVDGTELGSALVLPSREKLLTHNPYPRLSQTFLNAADCCDVAIFVGSSLRDHHIRAAAEATARRVPVFVVNPSGDTYALQNVGAIKQCASTFLIATLPHALMTTDPVAVLASVSAEASDDKGVLVAVRQALDTDSAADIRCRALELLDQMGIALDPYLLRRLLADQDPTVARYALGLISLSADRAKLVEEALATRHASEPAFREDLQLLRQMLPV
jgi:hypothetical protein